MLFRSPVSKLGSRIGNVANLYRSKIITTRNIINKTNNNNNMNNKFHVAEKLVLTDVESRICGLLKDYCNFYNTTNHLNDSESVILRITGGWVRDKLLGQGSHDLDIAINNMSGETFALGLNEYLLEHYSKYGVKPHSIHKIDKNPEKSKHLETATTKLFNIEVDFVNLRSEEYTELSRIPIVNFGTPEQDALRRDATLNALFYNIQTDSIEDYTGVGLTDLKRGVLRTPLPPRKTFLDDPLRVLRLIRFASRFNFKIDQDVLDEMADPEINKCFYSKISRERVGVEMEKILAGSNPLIAWKLIQTSHLENVIFFWHCNESVVEYNKKHLAILPQIDNIYNSGQLNQHMERFNNEYLKFLENDLETCPILQKKLTTNKQLRQNFMLGATLLPFNHLSIVALPQKKLNNTAPVVECIIKDGLKINKNDAITVSQAVDSINQYSEIVSLFNSKSNVLTRSQIGLFIRSFKGNWELVHLMAMFNDLLNSDGLQKITPTIIDYYGNFHSMIYQEDLQDSHSLRPLIDGKTLLKLLSMKPGPWMSGVVDEQIKWQLDHPNGEKDDLIEHIKNILPRHI